MNKIWTIAEINNDKEGYAGKVYCVSDDTFNKMREKCMNVDYLYVNRKKRGGRLDTKTANS